MNSENSLPILHNYFRSSASYRVRIALALKNIDYEYVAHHLRKGEQHSEAFVTVNPQGFVPALDWRDGNVLTQSLAIIEFLDETVPDPPLLPGAPHGRARVRSLSQMIACDIHPLNNLRVLKDLNRRFGADSDAVTDWFRHWVVQTFGPLEQRLSVEPETGRHCHGDRPTMADICLVAQVANNRRFNVDMTQFPRISAINDACLEIEAFRAAAPENQPDAE